MDDWQIFFNLLENNKKKSAGNEIVETICECEIGSIIYSPTSGYEFRGNCSITKTLASIKIDSHQSNYSIRIFDEAENREPLQDSFIEKFL